MSVRTSVPDRYGPRPEPPGGRGLLIVLTVLACALQTLVLLATVALLPLGWYHLAYVPAVVQAGLSFVLIARWASRRRAAVVLVPVLSAALTVALVFASWLHVQATGCTDEELAAAQQVAPPPGTSVDFESTDGRCSARSRMRLSDQAILQHYEAEFTRLGWERDRNRIPNRVGTTAGSRNTGIQMDVHIVSGAEGGTRAAQRAKEVVITVTENQV